MDKSQAGGYTAGDMVAYQNHVGIILQIDAVAGAGQDFVRMINDQGEVVKIKTAEITKKHDLREMRARTQAIDS